MYKLELVFFGKSEVSSYETYGQFAQAYWNALFDPEVKQVLVI